MKLIDKIDEIDKLISLSEQHTTLLKELKESTIYYSKKYCLVKKNIGYNDYSYMLYQISDNKRIVSGRIDRIKSHMRLHKKQ